MSLHYLTLLQEKGQTIYWGRSIAGGLIGVFLMLNSWLWFRRQGPSVLPDADSSKPKDPMLRLLPDDSERGRFETLLSSLAPLAHLFRGKRVLDFGASWGTSAVAMLRLGAASVAAVEPDWERVRQARPILAAAGVNGSCEMTYAPDTTQLPYQDAEFAAVLVNAVLEHIPEPRDRHLREIWRLVEPGGYLIVHETPNRYFPRELHTTDGLWFNHWLPREVAHRRAIRRGRFAADRTDWDSSGWRGLGYYEMVAPLSGYRLIPERTRLRHRILSFLGLPASLLDPYPTWVLRKDPLPISAPAPSARPVRRTPARREHVSS